MPPTKKLDLNIEIDVLTAGSAADVVNAILEFLLYQRNQIPFVYKIYEYYIGMWNAQTAEALHYEERQATTLHSFHLERQRELAKQTKESISAMRELIAKAFDKNSIKCLRFLFGATTFTPKEAYTIHIPTESISRKHCHNHHRIPHARLNQTLLSLLTSEDLYTIFSHNLCPTNLYLELEMLHDPVIGNDMESQVQFVPKDFSQLPPSCKDVHFHLVHTCPLDYGAMQLQCCKELQIFEDIMHLSLNDSDECCAAISNNKEQKTAVTADVGAWWEAAIRIRGFKEKPLKGRSIWTK